MLYSQLLISACDGGGKCDYGYLDINVDSNLNPPVLTLPSFATNYIDTVIIREDINTNAVIYTVSGTDSDTSVSFHGNK